MVHRRETGQSVAYRAVSAKRRNAVLLPARGIYTLACTAKCVPDTVVDSEKVTIRRLPIRRATSRRHGSLAAVTVLYRKPLGERARLKHSLVRLLVDTRKRHGSSASAVKSGRSGYIKVV